MENKISNEHSVQKLSTKIKYLENAKIGTLIAFSIPGLNKYGTGKLVSRYSENIVAVRSKDGSIVMVEYQDILWIKTGSRWPKGVFNLIRGECDGEAKD